MSRIVVVGGGPAGSAAALTAARAGVEVLLLESGRPNRDKPCGDGFLQSAIDHLFTLGLTEADLIACGGKRFSELSFIPAASQPVRHAAEGWVLRRASIDQALRDLASSNTQVVYDCRVLNVRVKRAGSWSVEMSRAGTFVRAPADAVVIATGASRRLAESLGIGGNPIRAASVTAYLEGFEADNLRFHLGPLYSRGYGWAFPAGSGFMNYGICSLRGPHQRLSDSLRQFLHTLIPASISTARSIRGGVGPLWSGDLLPRHHPAGAVSCGDTAGVADPLTGEGLTIALASGIAAGAAVARFVQERFTSLTLEGYTAWLSAFCSARYSATPVRSMFEGWLSD